MERPTLILNGGFKLPIGYRFQPTAGELVGHYLKRKVFGLPLPASVIPEFDVFQTDPWSLPGDPKEKNRYYFSKRKGDEDDKTCKRSAGSGYWKPIGKERQIIPSGTDQTMAIRKTLVFCQPKTPVRGTKSRWFMREYRLVGSATAQMFKMESWEDWAVYRVFQKKRKPTNYTKPCLPGNQNQAVQLMITPICIDLTVQDHSDLGPPPPSSPSFTGVMEDTFNGVDQEETSANISFYVA